MKRLWVRTQLQHLHQIGFTGITGDFGRGPSTVVTEVPIAINAVRDWHERIAEAPQQRSHYFLNDEGRIDEKPQYSVSFASKAEKSHLTFVEDAEWILEHSLLPGCVQNYFGSVARFVRYTRNYLEDALPPCRLPTTVKTRIFNYLTSDPLVDLRQPEARTPSMKMHVDGSVATLVIAESDGRLCSRLNGIEQPVGRKDHRPFAALLPGIAARHDFDLTPTPHCVLPNSEPRVSLTIFWTPTLGTDAGQAAEQLRQWRLGGEASAAA